MSASGVLAYLGLAVVSLDPFGGIVVVGALLRGVSRRALVTLLVSYIVLITAVILALGPLIRLAAGFLAPFLRSPAPWAIAQAVIALALIGVGIHQARTLRRPAEPAAEPRGVSPRAMAVAAALLAITSMPDPPFIASVGLAQRAGTTAGTIALLVAWNLIYQSPMLVLGVAGLTPWRDRAVGLYQRTMNRWRVPLVRTISVALLAIGAAVLIEAVLALIGAHQPWLHTLLTD